MSVLAVSQRMDDWLVAGIAPMTAKSYGAVGDGTTDDTAALQAAIDAAEAQDGGMIILDPGTYKVTDTLEITNARVGIQGFGKRSKIRAVGDYGHIISAVPGASTPPGMADLILRDFKIESATTRTSGAAIYTKWTHLALIWNVLIGDRADFNTPTPVIYDGINMDGQDCMIVGACDVNTSHYGLITKGLSVSAGSPSINTYYNYDGWVTLSSFRGSPSYISGSRGIHIADDNGGITLDNLDIAYHWDDIYLDGTNREVFLGSNVFMDSCGNCGFNNQGSISKLAITGIWAAGNGRGASGIRTAVYLGTIDYASIVGGRIYAAGDSGDSDTGIGLHQTSGKLTIGNVQLHNNKTSDIKLGSGCSETIITGCSLGSSTKLDDSSSGTKRYQANVGISDT